MHALRLTETTPLSEAGTGTSGRMKVHAITAGLGSSGYYSPEVLREAADNQLIAKGTPLFLDHASKSDRTDRPERSVRDIAAVFTEAAAYDDTEAALVGEIQVFAPYRDLLNEMAPHIGLSISGSATDIVEGEIDGKRVPIVEGFAKIDSVDFVTRAGRGGKVVELFESARVSKRAMGHGVAEATANDIRDALTQTLRDAYGGDKTYVWVRDFDPSTVWFEIESEGDNGIYAQAYAGDGTTLTGDRTEVRIQTSYVPVVDSTATEASLPIPAGRNTITTTESEEDTMGTINIEEAEHTRLVEQAGRVTVLESERDTAITERDAATGRATVAEAALADRDRGDAARRVIEAADTTFSPLEQRGLLADLPLAEDGTLDVAAFTATVTEAAATAGAGRVSGHGFHTSVTEAADSKTVAALNDAFQNLGLSESQSAIAVKGR